MQRCYKLTSSQIRTMCYNTYKAEAAMKCRERHTKILPAAAGLAFAVLLAYANNYGICKLAPANLRQGCIGVSYKTDAAASGKVGLNRCCRIPNSRIEPMPPYSEHPDRTDAAETGRHRRDEPRASVHGAIAGRSTAKQQIKEETNEVKK